jgi:hypothetical protein
LLEDGLHSEIHGPAGEKYFVPTAKISPLQMLPHSNWHQRPSKVVQISNKTVRVYGSFILGRVAEISFITKIVNDLKGIERKLNRRSVRAHMLVSIVKGTYRGLCRDSGGALSITDAGRSKSEVASVARQVSGCHEISKAVRAPKVIRQ